MMDEDIGTVRWFGTSWGAPMCDPRAHVDTPIEWCTACEKLIVIGDRGVGVPDGMTGEYHWWHLHCWLKSIAGDRVAAAAMEAIRETDEAP